MWYTSSMGLIEIEMTLEQAQSVAGPGDQYNHVKILSQVPKIKRQLNKIDKEKLKRELSEFGAWTDEQLDNHEENLIRILWEAGCSIVDKN
ncbi:hypothetical protein LCGC14_0580030 [marine sediment metagenome]|uniref:Uncharacterized protein n=1 Tax=marine sediment metagenome TaxID=412755 RepID=A0A0F9U2Z8_9ZZZZ